MGKMPTKWMQKVAERMRQKGTVGALRRQLGVEEGKKIPTSWLNKIMNAEVGETVSLNGKRVRVTTKLKRRANFALVARGK